MKYFISIGIEKFPVILYHFIYDKFKQRGVDCEISQ